MAGLSSDSMELWMSRRSPAIRGRWTCRWLCGLLHFSLRRLIRPLRRGRQNDNTLKTCLWKRYWQHPVVLLNKSGSCEQLEHIWKIQKEIKQKHILFLFNYLFYSLRFLLTTMSNELQRWSKDTIQTLRFHLTKLTAWRQSKQTQHIPTPEEQSENRASIGPDSPARPHPSLQLKLLQTLLQSVLRKKNEKRMEKQKQWQQGMTQRKLTVRNGRIHCHCEDGQQHDHFEIHSSSVFHSARAPGLTGGGTRLLLNPRRARSPASDAARGERERGRELMRPPLAYIYCPLAQPPVETLAANQNNQCPRAVSPASHCLLCPVCKWHERIRWWRGARRAVLLPRLNMQR